MITRLIRSVKDVATLPVNITFPMRRVYRCSCNQQRRSSPVQAPHGLLCVDGQREPQAHGQGRLRAYKGQIRHDCEVRTMNKRNGDFISGRCPLCGGDDSWGEVYSRLRLDCGYGSLNDMESLDLMICGECADKFYVFIQNRKDECCENE